MTHPELLNLHASALSERALLWVFGMIAAFIACLGIVIFSSALKAITPQNDQERIRAIEFWIHCG